MMKAGKKANELGIPVILDPVRAGASPLRTDTVFSLLEEVRFAVIRGNISEIKTLYVGNGLTKGVDAAASRHRFGETIDSIIALARELSQKTGAVIVITGATDFVVHQETAYVIKNGHEMMAKITGTGCMLSAVIGAVSSAKSSPTSSEYRSRVLRLDLAVSLLIKRPFRQMVAQQALERISLTI